MKVHIVEEEIPLLRPLVDMDRFGIHYDDVEDKLVQKERGDTADVTRFKCHLCLHWNPILQFLLNEIELRRLHSYLDRPNEDKLHRLFRRSELKNVDGHIR